MIERNGENRREKKAHKKSNHNKSSCWKQQLNNNNKTMTTQRSNNSNKTLTTTTKLQQPRNSPPRPIHCCARVVHWQGYHQYWLYTLVRSFAGDNQSVCQGAGARVPWLCGPGAVPGSGEWVHDTRCLPATKFKGTSLYRFGQKAIF